MEILSKEEFFELVFYAERCDWSCYDYGNDNNYPSYCEVENKGDMLILYDQYKQAIERFNEKGERAITVAVGPTEFPMKATFYFTNNQLKKISTYDFNKEEGTDFHFEIKYGK